jgi:hypothetical protein
MNYEKLDERLDLDNQMAKIASNFPQNNDDFMFFIRGKNSTGELFMASISESENFGYALFRIAVDNQIIKEQIISALKALEYYESQN